MTRRRSWSLPMKRFFLVFLMFGLASCGKQGPPRPPVPARPAAASDLAAAQRGTTVVLTWSYPALTTSGKTLDRLDRIVVYRLRESLPTELTDSAAAESNTAEGTSVPEEIVLFERVPAVTPLRFRAAAETLGELSREQIPSFTAGATVVVEDRPPLQSEAGQPLRFTYGVTAVRGQEESDLSNLVSIVPIDVPLPPDEPLIKAEPSGVLLTWSEPGKTVLGGSDPVVEGYNVYRLPASGGSVLTVRPLNATPIEAREFRDTPPYGTWRYAVTSVRYAGPPPHESQFPLLTRIEFVDRQPPPAPTDLSPLVEETVIRLIWTGVRAPDLAGYRVYRKIGGEPHEELTTEPITGTLFIDEGAVPGIEYRYGVTSVDRSGNESEPAMAGPVLIPR